MKKEFSNLTIVSSNETNQTFVIIDGVNYSAGCVEIAFKHEVDKIKNKGDIGLSLVMDDRLISE